MSVEVAKLRAQAVRLHEIVRRGDLAPLNLRDAGGQHLTTLPDAAAAMTGVAYDTFSQELPFQSRTPADVAKDIVHAVRRERDAPYNWTLWAGHHRGRWFPHTGGPGLPDDQPWYAPTDGGLRQDVLLPAGPGVNLSERIGDGWVPIGWCIKPEPEPVCGIESSVHVGFAFDLPAATVALAWFLPNEAFLETSTPLPNGTRLRTAASTNGGHGRWTIEPLDAG